MPLAKTPKRKMQARSSVTSRVASPASPEWTSGSEVLFQTPKSPSPVRRVTRRSSIYQTKTIKSEVSKFKMPLSKIVSPPGVKTRARQSSIYKKGGGKLLSPKNQPQTTRTRRKSMYVSTKMSQPAINEFSKVWATPVKPIEYAKKSPLQKSPVNSVASKIPKNKNVDKTTSPKVLKTRTATTKVALPKLTTGTNTPVAQKEKSSKSAANTPPVKKSPRVEKSPKVLRSVKASTKISPMRKSTPKPLPSTPVALPSPKKSPVNSTASKTLKSKNVTKKSPVKSVMSSSGKKNSKSPKISAIKTRTATPKVSMPKLITDAKTPVAQKEKSSKSAANTPAVKILPNAEKSPKVLKSVKKSAKISPVRNSTPKSLPSTPVALKSSKKSMVTTSTPTKTIEQISGRSFYSTPGETPILSQRTDNIVVFSAQPVKSAQKEIKAVNRRKTTFNTPVATPKKQVKRMPSTKTPAVKRSRDDSVSTPAAKRARTSPRNKVLRSAKKIEKPTDLKLTTSFAMLPVAKGQLSPVEMSSVLKSVVATEKRKAEESPSPRPRKLAKLAGEVVKESTPRPVKRVKRTSPKKLAELVDRNQSNNVLGFDQSPAESSMFNDTINTDSRSSRCTIL